MKNVWVDSNGKGHDMPTYYLATTERRKDAKRHVVRKSVNMNLLRDLARNLSERYIVEIYDGKWNLVETLNK